MMVHWEGLGALELFGLEHFREASGTALLCNGRVYTWKTTGIHNWLEAGCSAVDSLGFVVLPLGNPDNIELEDDDLGGS